MQGFEMKQLYLITTVVFSLILGANAFSYKNAKSWGKDNPQCNGKRQSPIIITHDSLELTPETNESLKLTNFEKLPEKLTIENTGHTVEIKANWSGAPPMFSGGPLHGNYVFEKVTFHWAQKAWSEISGAVEDKINDSNDVDMHVFFYKTDFKSFEKAEKQKGGLAVFKLRLRKGSVVPEYLFDNLENNLHKVRSLHSKTEIPPFRLTSYVGNQIMSFVFYEGSLDYPPCYETVTWFIGVFDTEITDRLINEFRKIKLSEGDVSNVRPVQPANKRKVGFVFTAYTNK